MGIVESRKRRLTGPVSVALHTALSPSDAAARLGRAIDPALRNPARYGGDLYVVWGSVADTSLRVRTKPEAWERRRKGWSVQLDAHLEAAGLGTVLRGTVDIANENFLRGSLPILRVVALAPALIAVALAVSRGAAPEPSALVNPVAVSAFLIAGLFAVNRSIQRAAADDAEALVAIVASIIGSPEGNQGVTSTWGRPPLGDIPERLGER